MSRCAGAFRRRRSSAPSTACRPGTSCAWPAAGRESVRYWHPAPRSPDDWVTEEELARVPGVFAPADRPDAQPRARRHLPRGGLDSVSVAGVARERSRAAGVPAPLALSLAMPNEHCNEEEIQRAVAGRLGLPQIMLSLEEAAGTDNLLVSACAPAANGRCRSRTTGSPPTRAWRGAASSAGARSS